MTVTAVTAGDTTCARGTTPIRTVTAPERHWTKLREVTDRGCVVVRPDRFVAWRSDDVTDDPTATLATAMTRILGR